VAHAYGFDSWPKLKGHVDGITAKQFIAAARANDVDRVAGILKLRPDLTDMQWSYGDERRALHYAVMQRLPAMVCVLMQSGADAHAGVYPYRDATTPRTMAVERDFQEIVTIIDEEERKRRQTSMSGAPLSASPQAGSDNPPPGRTSIWRRGRDSNPRMAALQAAALAASPPRLTTKRPEGGIPFPALHLLRRQCGNATFPPLSNTPRGGCRKGIDNNTRTRTTEPWERLWIGRGLREPDEAPKAATRGKWPPLRSLDASIRRKVTADDAVSPPIAPKMIADGHEMIPVDPKAMADDAKRSAVDSKTIADHADTSADDSKTSADDADTSADNSKANRFGRKTGASRAYPFDVPRTNFARSTRSIS
jgi:hypothetical protein